MRKLILFVFVLFSLVFFISCGEQKDFDNITARVTLDKKAESPLFKITRRYLFDRDLSKAPVYLKEVQAFGESEEFGIKILAKIKVFAIMNNEKILVAENPKVISSKTYRDLKVLYDKDIRQLLKDNTIELEWEIQMFQSEWELYRKKIGSNDAGFYFTMRFLQD